MVLTLAVLESISLSSFTTHFSRTLVILAGLGMSNPFQKFGIRILSLSLLLLSFLLQLLLGSLLFKPTQHLLSSRGIPFSLLSVSLGSSVATTYILLHVTNLIPVNHTHAHLTTVFTTTLL